MKRLTMIGLMLVMMLGCGGNPAGVDDVVVEDVTVEDDPTNLFYKVEADGNSYIYITYLDPEGESHQERFDMTGVGIQEFVFNFDVPFDGWINAGVDLQDSSHTFLSVTMNDTIVVGTYTVEVGER